MFNYSIIKTLLMIIALENLFIKYYMKFLFIFFLGKKRYSHGSVGNRILFANGICYGLK